MANYSGNGLSKTGKTVILLFATSVFFVIYVFRLFSMQITNGEEYKTQSRTISSQISTLPASRGEIYDRNADMPLVINNDSFAVEVTPGEIPNGKYDTVMIKLAGYLGITKEQIDAKIPKNVRRSYSSIQIKTNVPFSSISNIAENKSDLPGVSWVSKPVRNYAYTTLSLSHIIGYVGDIDKDEMTVLYNKGYTKSSVVGKTGIEKQYDELLQGKSGRELVTVDVHGRIISDAPIVEPPEMGKKLVLTIDSTVQKLVEDSLGERVGAAVVLKPATGEVLAMVSYPNYDSNLFTSDDAANLYSKLLNDSSKPLINRAVQISYPPASTFKIVMSAAMLQEKAFPSSKKIECKGKMVYGGRTFHCHVHTGHGFLDLKNAMAQSCDVYYWTIGRDYLGIEKIASYAKEFGFGQSSQIDLPSQVTGLVPTAEWKQKKYHEKWVGGDTMSCSIGQGFMEATPLQLANMIAMVSNEGVIYKPHLLKEVRDPVTDEVISEVQPTVLTESTIDNAVWKEIQEALRYTVTDGTPQYPMNNKIVQIACKTGTAEVEPYSNPNRKNEQSWHSWLVAYAPYDAPPEDRICVATIVEACNTWEWWAPYCTNIIIQGYFANQTFDEAIHELGFEYLINQQNVNQGRME
ncbi:MAG: penicillin-binding protein 2 [Treponema sp.]|nr:penicillin-binding protein 2 [Treponema sp.]